MHSFLVAAALIALLCEPRYVGGRAERVSEVSAAGTSAAAPALQYLRLLGGGRSEQDARVAVGGGGNVFLAGTTYSTNWPIPWQRPCAVAPPGACGHAFLLKLGPDGTRVYYAVALGGSRQQQVTGLAVDRAGNAYLAGTTTSADFPTVSALQRGCGGPTGACADGFVAKVDPRGHLVYSTYLGGRGDDRPAGIAVDRRGDAYVAGSTTSPNYPLARAMQRRYGGNTDGFVTKISASGRQILYSTYLGGSGQDGASSVAVGRAGEAYVAGVTASANLRTSAHSLQPRWLGGNCLFFTCSDAFVTELGTAGRFFAGTFVATRANDLANAIAVDPAGNVYLAGSTGADRIPSTHGTIEVGKHFCGEEGDIFPCQSAFVVELTPRLDQLVYSRILGGNGLDRADAVTVDSRGRTLVGGYTESSTFPTIRATQPATGGGECSEGKGGSAPCDGFVAVIVPHGSAITFGTYLGGDGLDDVESVAVDARGGVLAAGTTWSGNLTGGSASPPTVAPRIFFARIANALP